MHIHIFIYIYIIVNIEMDIDRKKRNAATGKIFVQVYELSFRFYVFRVWELEPVQVIMLRWFLMWDFAIT